MSEFKYGNFFVSGARLALMTMVLEFIQDKKPSLSRCIGFQLKSYYEGSSNVILVFGLCEKDRTELKKRTKEWMYLEQEDPTVWGATYSESPYQYRTSGVMRDPKTPKEPVVEIDLREIKET